MTVGVVTPCDAATCPNCGECIYPNPGLAGAIMAAYNNTIEPAIAYLEYEIMAWWTVVYRAYKGAFLLVLDWVAGQMVDWFSTLWHYNLYPSLQAMARQLSVADTEQAFALGMFSDAKHFLRVKRTLEDLDLAGHRAQRVSDNVCVAGSMMGGMTRAALFSRAYNATAPAERLDRSANALRTVPEGSGAKVPSLMATGAAAGTNPDMKARWDAYRSRYCRDKYNNGYPVNGDKGCIGTNDDGSTDRNFADQDIDVIGQIFMKDTIDLTDYYTMQNLDALIINIAEPFVKDSAPPGSDKNVTGQAAILDAQAYKAKRQLVYDSLYHLVARRVQGSGQQMKEFIASIREDAGLDPITASENPSRNEVMQALLTERFRSGTYALQQIDEPENNRREMVIEQALQVMQMSDQLDLMDRYSLLLASKAGMQIRTQNLLSVSAGGAPVK